MDFLDNLETQDEFAAALTLGPNFAAVKGLCTVANQSARVSFARGQVGNWEWTRELLVPPTSFPVRNVIGVRFRTAVAGSPARIVAQLLTLDDVDLEAGTPFTQTLAESGEVSGEGGGVMTGRVNGDGTIAGGTGFTVAHVLPGSYTVTFTEAFAAIPVILLAVETRGNPDTIGFSDSSPPTAASFTVRTFAGAIAIDRFWHFTAQAVV